MEYSLYQGIPGNATEDRSAWTDNAIMDAIFDRATKLAVTKHKDRPVSPPAAEVEVISYDFLINLPWKIKSSLQRVLDEWGLPTVVKTEDVVAVDRRGRQYQLPAFPEELRHYIVDTHNQRLWLAIKNAEQQAKPKQFHKLQSLDDLQDVFDQQKDKEQQQELFDRQRGQKRPPLTTAGTRLDPMFAKALKRIARKLNVSDGFLHRAGLEDYYRHVVEREIEEITQDREVPAPIVSIDIDDG